MKPNTPRGFTLVELLVVVAIIVLLLALLVPAMDKAVTAAEKAICLANQRNIVQGCHFYATDNRRHWPYWPTTDGASDFGTGASAYDWRTPWNEIGMGGPSMEQGIHTPLTPAGFGQLPANGYLPTTKLGKVAHCPSINNTSSSIPGVGMDRTWIRNWGAGGSWWVLPSFNMRRIVGSYNYRAASWFNAGKGWIKTPNLGPDEVISVDLPDMRFGGRQFIHPDGWNRVFADGHGAFLNKASPIGQSQMEKDITAYTTGGNDVAGQNASRGTDEEIYVYPYLARN